VSCLPQSVTSAPGPRVHLKTWVIMTRLTRSLLTTLLFTLVVAACKGGDGGGTGPEPRTTATLQCVGPTGQLFICDLELTSAGGFEVELLGSACQAHGNTLRLTKPSAQTLTEDGCYAPAGTKWTFAGPFNAGTKVGMEVEAAELEHAPVLRVTGAYPEWHIEFEDGFDADFDDLRLAVRATP
jgi:hypothetical protein